MTRGEAIDCLDGLKVYPKTEHIDVEAYDMAIEALSAEAAIGDYPNDLISRRALMEYCSNQKSKSIDNNDIARFPSAEAEVYEDYEHATLVDIKAPLRESAEAVQGKWETAYLDHEAMGERPSVIYCSRCNHCFAYKTNFCPNCGADMRGEKHE